MEHSRYFSFSVQEPGGRTSRYFSILAKVFHLLLLLDHYLLSHFKVLKQQISYPLLDSTFSDLVTIKEQTAYEGEIGTILRLYLKTGKELVLSSLLRIETTSDLDELLKKVSDLVYQTQEELKSQEFLDVLTHSSLDKIALARIVNHFWLYFSKNGASTPITVDSLVDSPKVAFSKKPPLVEWLPPIEEISLVGRFELCHIDFGDSKKWRAVLSGYLSNRPMLVEIEALGFLESLKSAEGNEENGILHGDIIVARYSILQDPLLNKTTIKILEVVGRARQSQDVQFEFFPPESDPTPEPSPVPGVRKLAGKKKHSSWH